MNRRTRTLIVLGAALSLAALASFMVFRAIQKMPVRQVEVATMHVAVATQSLPTGTMLAKDQVKIVGWPAASPVPGSFATVEQIVGRGLIQPVLANEPITESKLAALEAGAGLPPSIPAGMRAMSVRTNDVIGVAGFTVPGTHVDVLLTLNHQSDSMARVVVSNVKVLTAGTMYDQREAKGGKPIPSTVVTLAVTPEDAERIALAQSTGRIVLVLRNPLDVLPTDTKGIRMAALMGEPAPPPVEKKVKGIKRMVVPKPVSVEPAIYRVEAIRAAKRTEEVVR